MSSTAILHTKIKLVKPIDGIILKVERKREKKKEENGWILVKLVLFSYAICLIYLIDSFHYQLTK